MSCCGQREKGQVQEYHKWDYISLSDFKSSSCTTTLSYVWLWVLALVAVAVYGLDTFTAVNLLAFNKWSSEVQPAISFDISKWIFSGCIIMSWVLCFYEWMRAIRVMKRGSVADDYMDPLAVKLQSMRSNGYRKFVVFAKLTDSKRGNDYVALFAYFQFKGMLRVLLAEGPRQVINAITLVGVAEAQIFDHGKSGFSKLWANIQALAAQNNQQVVILCSMLFTLIIWIFSVTSLLVAFILYLTFLWHFIPVEDGTVAIYCRRKIEKRLERTVSKNYQAMLEREAAQRRKAEKEALRAGKQLTNVERKPTLPALPGTLPTPSLSRQTTETLPPYPGSITRTNTTTSAPGAAASREPKLPSVSSGSPLASPTRDALPQPTLPSIEAEQTDHTERPSLARTTTQGSSSSSRSGMQAPLIAGAAKPGYSNAQIPRHDGFPRPENAYSTSPNGYPPSAMQSMPPPRSASANPLENPPIQRRPPPRAMTGAPQPWRGPPPRSMTDPHNNGPSAFPNSFSPTRQDFEHYKQPQSSVSQPQPPPWPHPSLQSNRRHGSESYEMQARTPPPPNARMQHANMPPAASAYQPEVYRPSAGSDQGSLVGSKYGHQVQQEWGAPSRFDPSARFVASPSPISMSQSPMPRAGTAPPPGHAPHNNNCNNNSYHSPVRAPGPPRRAATGDIPAGYTPRQGPWATASDSFSSSGARYSPQHTQRYYG